MPKVLLPTLLPSEVALHKSERSCYVTVGSRIYDVTKFLKNHPGGGDLILKYGGEDVSEIMAHGPSHKHTEAAYSILDDYLIGYYLVTKSYERPCERPNVKSLAALPPVYRETSIDSLADPLTFIEPRTGLLQNKQLALGERKIAGSGQTYYLDPLRFMHAKSKGITTVESGKDPAFGDDYYIKNLQDDVKSPSNPLSDQRLWYRIVPRALYSLKAIAETTAKAISFLLNGYGLGLAVLIAISIYDACS